jgi:uncharacterized membrane protein
MPVPLSDLLGLLVFIAIWVCYTWYTDRGEPRQHSLRAAMHRNRYRWMAQLLNRSNRIMDAQILGHLAQGASFFASTSLLILVGLFTLLGYTDEAMVMLKRVPFTKNSLPQWELKILTMIVVFVYAFFKFTWGLRQFNYCSVLLGGAPEKHDDQRAEEFVRRTAWLSTLASKDFNQGLRAYYFGLAVLAWFINVTAFIAATVLILFVLYWREYRSEALRTLEFSADSQKLSELRP